MTQNEHVGLIGGLGVEATVFYYRGIAAACAARSIVPRLTMTHADARTALALVQAGCIDDLATYLASLVAGLAASGATFFAIPAVTPHINALEKRASLPIVNILQVTVERLRARGAVAHRAVRHPVHDRA
jgi:aspartate racemase